jgi:hypothetical protein
MDYRSSMSNLSAFAGLFLLLPVAVLLVGLANLRRHKVRAAELMPDEQARR